MEDIELDGGHSVESAQNVGDRKEVAAGIEHESAPGEAGRVFNVDGGKDVGGTGGLKELKERLHAVEGADVGFGAEGDLMLIDVEGVAFIDVQLGNGLRGDGGDVDGEGWLAAFRGWRLCEGDAGACFEAAGRMFPVAEFFLPPMGDEELPQHVARAVDWLGGVEPRGDVLVFLPGEREIRECAEVLEGRRYASTEVLPLFARLGLGDQQRVFNPGHA